MLQENPPKPTSDLLFFEKGAAGEEFYVSSFSGFADNSTILKQSHDLSVYLTGAMPKARRCRTIDAHCWGEHEDRLGSSILKVDGEAKITARPASSAARGLKDADSSNGFFFAGYDSPYRVIFRLADRA